MKCWEWDEAKWEMGRMIWMVVELNILKSRCEAVCSTPPFPNTRIVSHQIHGSLQPQEYHCEALRLMVGH
jgi:hypothetical protein